MMHKPFHITTVLFDLEGPLAAAAGSRRVPHALAKGMVGMLRARGLGMGVVSHHTQKAVLDFLKHRFQMRPADIRPCICLEAPCAGSRRRNPFTAAARSMHTAPQRFMVVSADRDMLRLAKDAGTVAVEWCANGTLDSSGPVTDYRVGDLQQLDRLIRMGVPLPAGKLPNDLLKEFLDEFTFEDPALLINPGVGEDIAAVDVAQEEVLVLKSDPITFATDAIGHYAVLVNANDIATAGALPRWLLTTLLFPVGSTPSLILSIVYELRDSCRTWGITLCGGHTEITDAVSAAGGLRDDGRQCPQARPNRKAAHAAGRPGASHQGRGRGRHCHHRPGTRSAPPEARHERGEDRVLPGFPGPDQHYP